MAFRRDASPDALHTVQLREIDPAADYDVTKSIGYERSSPKRVKGADITSLKLHIEQQPGSLIIEYKKVESQK
jgi:hypothetical protein